MPTNARVYISLVSAAGLAAIAYTFLDPPWSHDIFRFCAYFALSTLASMLKLRLPGLTGTMSVGFVFVLLGISQLTLPETMLLGCAGVLVQCLWRTGSRPSPVQLLFSVSAVAASVFAAYQSAEFLRSQLHLDQVAIITSVATCVYFVSNSLLVSGVLSLVKCQPMRAVWQQCYLFAFPYYLAGGAVAGLMTAGGREVGWKPPLLILPVIALVFLFYRMYLARLAMQPLLAEANAPALQTIKARSA